MLFQCPPQIVNLKAYLTSPTMNLDNEQWESMLELSSIINNICEEHSIHLYVPWNQSHSGFHGNIPESEAIGMNREKVTNSDLLIHLCHYTSTGAGEELEIASNALIPIILISHGVTQPSRMIMGIPAFKTHLTYSEPEEIRQVLSNQLQRIRPVLEERKLAFSEFALNTVGEKIRLRREELGLTREEVANSLQCVTLETLQQIEDSVDSISNPTLIQLRAIATILKTTVADLVEPDLHTRFLAALNEWMSEGRVTARYPGLSSRDWNILFRRMLLRIIDSLDDD